MSFALLKKYIWLVDTIRSAGKISKDEIDRKWRNTISSVKSNFP